MRNLLYVLLFLAVTSCAVPAQYGQGYPAQATYQAETPITQSLFNDRASTISEDNIKKILDGNYALPNDLRVSLVKIEGTQSQRNFYRSNEQYLKSQQEYLDLFTAKFKASNRVTKVSKIPDMLISHNPTFTTIREAAVRTQSDIVVIYAINSDLYARYKLFSKSDIKAFATTELIILDVRTGLIPFSTIVTREFQSKRDKNELNEAEAANRIKNKAILLTIDEIGQRINTFLAKK